MKWSWKAFGLYLGASFGLGLAFAYALSFIIDARRGPGAPDSTLFSLAIGGIVAPLLLAALSVWKGWSLKPLLAAGFIVSVTYSGNLGPSLATLLFAALVYFATRKLRTIIFYYLPSKNPEASEATSADD